MTWVPHSISLGHHRNGIVWDLWDDIGSEHPAGRERRGLPSGAQSGVFRCAARSPLRIYYNQDCRVVLAAFRGAQASGESGPTGCVTEDGERETRNEPRLGEDTKRMERTQHQRWQQTRNAQERTHPWPTRNARNEPRLATGKTRNPTNEPRTARPTDAKIRKTNPGPPSDGHENARTKPQLGRIAKI